MPARAGLGDAEAVAGLVVVRIAVGGGEHLADARAVARIAIGAHLEGAEGDEGTAQGVLVGALGGEFLGVEPAVAVAVVAGQLGGRGDG